MSGIINATNLEVANIKDSTGTNTAMTVDSSGRILTPQRPAFATVGTNYTQSSNAYSIIIPNSETFDTGNNYNASTGVFTTPVNGLYLFGFWGLSYPHTGHANTVAYHKNGSIVGQGIQQTGDSAQHNLSSGSLLLQLTANDTIDLRYYQNTSSGSSAKAYNTQWNMYGYLIG